MERVGTLLDKLQQQLVNHAPANELLLTVQILQSELFHLQGGISFIKKQSVAIEMPYSTATCSAHNTPVENSSEKIVEILQIDEAEIEAELKELKNNAQAFNKLSVQNKPHILFEVDDELPTFAHHAGNTMHSDNNKKDVNEVPLPLSENSSINNKLIQDTIPFNDTEVHVPIRDLKKAIDTDTRTLFINVLFRGDEPMYERSIKTINNFTILPEAEYWIQRELKVKIGWSESNPVVKQFNQLIKRRFS
ncbi:MAG: hypothetical protein IPJ81_17670 [Chitinophagaceae bacterium]|nr:hypothetical protein [Chitinophagaceae bacterium]